MRGIDISNHQADLDLSRVECDFVIIKATEGKSYVDPYCDSFFKKAMGLNKKIGIYHFANNVQNTAEQEADWFINNTRGYIGKAIPILDWESSNTSDISWAKRWLDIVSETYGYKAMIYMSESIVNRYDWSSVANADYGLWVAKYRDNNPDYNYDMSNAGSKPSVKHWNFYSMWQWTSTGKLEGYSGNLDCNEFYGDSDTWDKYINKVEKIPDLQYQVHIQDKGWMNWQNAGEGAGTEGQSLRLEAIKFKGNNGLKIEYQAHVQDIGWQDWKKDGEIAGTTGQSLRLEAIRIKCNKTLEVQEHIQDIGWTPKFKSKEFVIGTEGKALRLGAFKINVME